MIFRVIFRYCVYMIFHGKIWVNQEMSHLTKGENIMKVKLEERYKDIYTLSELETAKRIIKEVKEDAETAKGYAVYAATEALKGASDAVVEVLKAEAHTALNRRIYDAYFEGSGRMDVWIDFTVQTQDGFIIGGAYLTDIYSSGAVDYKDHMFIKMFKAA